MTADDIIRILELIPHPEGGHYREIYRHTHKDGSRGFATSIYYLLRAGECSSWHRHDALEVFYHHAGSPLEIEFWVGSNLLAGESLQANVPAGAWQTAKTLGDWKLIGCAVAPSFEFAGFDMAPDVWTGPTYEFGPPWIKH